MIKNTEKYLQKFRLKDPPPNLKRLVVEYAETRWRQQENNNLPPKLTAAIKIVCYSVVAAVILMLSIAFFNMPEQTDDVIQNSKELDLLIELGISKKNASLIISSGKIKKYPDCINLKILNKEI